LVLGRRIRTAYFNLLLYENAQTRLV